MIWFHQNNGCQEIVNNKRILIKYYNNMGIFINKIKLFQIVRQRLLRKGVEYVLVMRNKNFWLLNVDMKYV